MGKEKRSRIAWLNHFVGFISVVLGVLIAFWLNSWNETRKEERSIRTALQNIKLEINKNLASLDSITLQNEKQLELLRSFVEKVDNEMNIMVPDDEWKKFAALYPQQVEQNSSGIRLNLDLFQLSEVAWATTHRTGILASIDFELAYTLEAAYDLQEKVNEFDANFITDLRAITNRKESFVRVLRSLEVALNLAHQLKQRDYPAAINAIDIYLEK